MPWQQLPATQTSAQEALLASWCLWLGMRRAFQQHAAPQQDALRIQEPHQQAATASRRQPALRCPGLEDMQVSRETPAVAQAGAKKACAGLPQCCRFLLGATGNCLGKTQVRVQRLPALQLHS